MTMTRAETAAWLRQQDHFAILTHRRPDGDTLGSAAALCRMLRALGKTAHVLENPEITDRYTWLHEGLTKKEAQAGDTIVCVDVAAPNMLPDCFGQYLGSIALRIDHHGGRESFSDWELVDASAGACAEILWDIRRELGLSLDGPTADAIYVGTATDTGCFRFANTTAHTFATAAACAEGHARIYELNQALFETNTLQRLKIQSWIVEHIRIFGNGELALVAIPKAVEREIGVTEDDMDNITSFPRTVAGVHMASTLRQTPDGATKLSVRAIPGLDATTVAAAFGGGGHKGAAGATLTLPLEEAAKAVETEMRRYYGKGGESWIADNG